jgi:MFS family permease
MKLFDSDNLLFINISSGIAMGMMSFIIPVYAINLKATSTEIGLINGISGIGDLLMVFPAGFLISRFGSKKIYSVSCVFGASIVILLSFAVTPKLLLITMVFYGMSRTLRMTSLNTAFFRNMKSFGAKKVGWYNGSMTIGGSFLGPIIGGVAAISMGFTGYVILTGAFLLLPLTIIFANKNGNNNSAVKSNNSSLVESSNNYTSLLQNRILVSATITGSLNTAFFIVFTTFITVLVIRDLGFSPEIAAMLISLKGGATILTMFFGGRFLLRNNRNIYLFSFIITIFSLLLFVMSKKISIFLIASVIQGIGAGLIAMLNITQIGNIDGEKGKIASIFSLGSSIGTIFGPALAGIIGDAFGVRAIFLSFIPLFVALSLFTFMQGRKQN